MIKSLLGEDENTEKRETPENKGDSENSTSKSLSISEKVKTQNDEKTDNSVIDTKENEIESIEEIKTAIETGDIPSNESANNHQIVKPFEVNKPIGQPIIEREIERAHIENKAVEQANETSSRTLELENKLRELEEELKKEKELEELRAKEEAEAVQVATTEGNKTQTTAQTSGSEVATLVKSDKESVSGWNDWEKDDALKKAEQDKAIKIQSKDFVPDSQIETIRKSGMAYSAGIALFGSVVFMMILGWGADLLLGTSPWGIVVGIVIGSVIGLVQFVRTTMQIVKPKPNNFDKVSLKSNLDTVEEKKVEEKPAEKVEENNAEKSPEDKKNEKAESVIDSSEKAETVVKTDS